MAKTTAPLLSFGASGAIAKTQVYSRWKGIPYARRYVIPSNPKTAAQQEVRDTFRFLNNLWRFMPADAITAWSALASSQPLTARNAWLKLNVSPLISQADLTNLTLSPSARNGPVAADIVLTPGDDQIQAVLTAPDLPTGWTIVKAIVAAVEDQDPQSGAAFEVTADTDDTAPYDITLTGLKDATTYLVGGWFEYTRPDSSLAYGVSLQDTALTT